MLLFNTLHEKFTNAQLLRDLNEEIRKAKKIADDATNENRQLKLANSAMSEGVKKLEAHLTRLIDGARSDKNYSDAVR